MPINLTAIMLLLLTYMLQCKQNTEGNKIHIWKVCLLNNMSACQQSWHRRSRLFFSLRNRVVQHVKAIKTSMTLSLREAIKHSLTVIVQALRGDIILLLWRPQKDNKPPFGCGQFTTLYHTSGFL